MAQSPRAQRSPKKNSHSISDPRQGQIADAFRNLDQRIQHCHKAVFFTDAAGVLQRVNPAFERLTGYASAESLGKDLSWMAADGSGSESYRRLWQEIYENRAFRGILEVRRRDGNCLHMELTAIPVHDRDGQIASLICTGRDMREGQVTTVKLNETRKLDAVATVARAVAHDLNNTLMVISSRSELALEDLSHENPLWRQLHDIKSAAQRAGELAGELLALSRNDSHARQLVSLKSLVQETCRVLPRITGADIQLNLSLDEERGAIDANVTQLRQLLLDLAISVRDALPKGGRLNIATKTSESGPLRARKFAVLSLSVSRTAKELDRAPSVMISRETVAGQRWISESELAAVEDFARENHGFVSLERGSYDAMIVNVFFPLVETNLEAFPPDSGLRPVETVLLVEDEALIRKAETEFLSSEGYNVLSATNGQDAFEQILSHPGKIDLVITDIIMPHMSGLRLAEAAAAIRPDTKVLFVSGSVENCGQRAAVPSESLLMKPFSLRALNHKIREVLAATPRAARNRAAGAGAD